jgi:hypothetical protein
VKKLHIFSKDILLLLILLFNLSGLAVIHFGRFFESDRKFIISWTFTISSVILSVLYILKFNKSKRKLDDEKSNSKLSNIPKAEINIDKVSLFCASILQKPADRVSMIGCMVE